MYVGRDAVLLTLDVPFHAGTPAERVAATVAALENSDRPEIDPLYRRRQASDLAYLLGSADRPK